MLRGVEMKIRFKVSAEVDVTSVFQSNPFRVMLLTDKTAATIYWISGGKLMKYPYVSERVMKWIERRQSGGNLF